MIVPFFRKKGTQADISGHISAMLSHICGVYDKGAFKYDITPGGGGRKLSKKRDNHYIKVM